MKLNKAKFLLKRFLLNPSFSASWALVGVVKCESSSNTITLPTCTIHCDRNKGQFRDRQLGSRA